MRTRSKKLRIRHSMEPIEALVTYLRWSDRGRRAERLKRDWRDARRTETVLHVGAVAVAAGLLEAALRLLVTHGATLPVSGSVRVGVYVGFATPVLLTGMVDLTVRMVGRERYERTGLRFAARKLRGEGGDGWPVVAQLLRLSCGEHPAEGPRWTLPWHADRVTEKDRSLALRLLGNVDALPLERLSVASQKLARRDHSCWRCGAAGVRGKVSDLVAFADATPARQEMVVAMQERWGDNWGADAAPRWSRNGWDDEDLFGRYGTALRAELTDRQAETITRLIPTWVGGDVRALIETGRTIS